MAEFLVFQTLMPNRLHSARFFSIGNLRFSEASLVSSNEDNLQLRKQYLIYVLRNTKEGNREPAVGTNKISVPTPACNLSCKWSLWKIKLQLLFVCARLVIDTYVNIPWMQIQFFTRFTSNGQEFSSCYEWFGLVQFIWFASDMNSYLFLNVEHNIYQFHKYWFDIISSFLQDK